MRKNLLPEFESNREFSNPIYGSGIYRTPQVLLAYWGNFCHNYMIKILNLIESFVMIDF